jgi:hypothetical protein
MPGSLPGAYFKLVIGNMLSVRLMFPDIQKRVTAMSATQMYPWDEYTTMMQALAKELPTDTVVQIGKKIVRDSKGHFMSQGFDSATAILKNWGALFDANVVGAPKADSVQTIEFSPGSVTVAAGLAQPEPLVEGYLRGVVEMFGGRVTAFSTARGNHPAGGAANLLSMKWQ